MYKEPKSIKYKFMYMNKDPNNKKSLQILMEESTVGGVINCTNPREIEKELKELLAEGWALKVKKELSDWGYLLYMERLT